MFPDPRTDYTHFQIDIQVKDAECLEWTKDGSLARRVQEAMKEALLKAAETASEDNEGGEPVRQVRLGEVPPPEAAPHREEFDVRQRGMGSAVHEEGEQEEVPLP